MRASTEDALTPMVVEFLVGGGGPKGIASGSAIGCVGVWLEIIGCRGGRGCHTGVGLVLDLGSDSLSTVSDIEVIE